jgi:PAS domain S-box-containing protein
MNFETIKMPEGNVSASTSFKTCDDWIKKFQEMAEFIPACIVISEMTLPGAPMIYVNEEFCNTTGYSREESIGRNCRFLQGPLTEPEAVEHIRNSISKVESCSVKLINYRKNGETFYNLLSLKPVLDSNGVYRYVIGVQFEIIERGANLRERLTQVEKLIFSLPSKINLPSR